MKDKIEEIKAEIEGTSIRNDSDLEAFRMRFIGRKSVFNELFARFKSLPPEEKKLAGKWINDAKNLAEVKFKSAVNDLKKQRNEQEAAPIDLTLPPPPQGMGTIHPLTQTRMEMIRIFERIGFTVSDGPEIEDDWHNFTALNFPENHPAREMQDTYFIEQNPDITLRTHTSSVQIRVMEQQQPPIRTLSPGRVYRNEAISARAHCFFHQVEGLYVDEGVSFADLKQTLYYFAREMFSKNTQVRFRPSFFPFTEPSAELDITCLICKGEGCKVCKYSGWLEIGGAGMVDPNVLKNCDIDPDKYTGFAFGCGIERIAMLKYEIHDLRLFSENDVRFLNQFSRA